MRKSSGAIVTGSTSGIGGSSRRGAAAAARCHILDKETPAPLPDLKSTQPGPGDAPAPSEPVAMRNCEPGMLATGMAVALAATRTRAAAPMCT